MSLAAAFCLFLPPASAQNIPDPNFADAIRDDCPVCIDINNNLTSYAQIETSLEVSYSQISSLAGIEGFTNLQTLECQYNSLDSLPDLPASLKLLYCDYNQLSFLPALPDSLTHLYCEDNQLSSLPALSANLTYMRCGYNQLTSLPALPDGLKNLYCYHTELISLPALPASLMHLNCRFNSSLSCLSALPNGLLELYTSGTQITCIPNQPLNLSMNPVLPLCSVPCDSTTSASNIYAAKPFNVQPNPVSELLQVRFSVDFEENADFRLLDSGGRIVRALSAKGDVEIPVRDLPTGIYWLEVRGARWIFGEKILKN